MQTSPKQKSEKTETIAIWAASFIPSAFFIAAQIIK